MPTESCRARRYDKAEVLCAREDAAISNSLSYRTLLFTLALAGLTGTRAFGFDLDLHDLEKVEASILDNPSELAAWVEIKAAKKETLDPLETVRLTRLKFTQQEEQGTGQPRAQEMEEAIATALKLGFHSDAVDLMFLRINDDITAKRLTHDADIEAALRQLVELASSMPEPIWRARALVHLSSFFDERGRADEALSTIQEAYTIVQNMPQAPGILKLPVLLHLSTILNTNGQQDKAFVIFQAAQAICDAYRLRFASQRNLYAIGKHYGRPGGPFYDLDKAATYTLRALAIAEELGASWEIGIIHTSLISVEMQRKRLDEAQKHARIALKLFEASNDPIWSAEVHSLWARILYQRKDYSQALVHLDKAAQLFPVAYKRDHAPILRLRSQIMKDLGHTDRALTAFEQYHQIQLDLADTRENDNYARSKAALGLQIEEQKNKTLTAEKALTEQKLKNARLYTLFGLVSFAFLIGLAFLAFRLHRENRKIIELQDYIHRGVLLRFLPPMIVDEIISGRSRLESEPKEELVTVIFADISNFTRLTEQAGVNHTAQILNRFLQTMTEVIFAAGGTIDKFIGDAVMVLYGAPSPLRPEEQAEKAIQCATAMHEAVTQLSRELEKDFGVSLAIRIGINQGRAIVGTFGSVRRSDYTAVGPAVNLASRIEAKADSREILMSASVAELLPPARIRNRGLHTVKGYDQQVQLFAWIADDPLPSLNAAS